MDDFIDFCIIFFGGAFAFVALVLGLALGFGAIFYYGGTKPACEQYSRLTGAETSTQFFGAGCLVKHNGEWVDYDVAIAKKQEITLKQK